MANRISQIVRQTVIEPTPEARVSQVVQQVIFDPHPPVRLSQVVRQVIVNNVPDDAQPPRTSRASFVG